MPTSGAIVQVRAVHKYFTRGSEQVDVLNDLTLEVAEGEFLALMGPSGSGKTTLLESDRRAGSAQPRRSLGRRPVDFRECRKRNWPAGGRGTSGSFSSSIICCRCSARYENVELPLLLLPLSAAQRKQQVMTALELVGLDRPIMASPRATFRRPAAARRHCPGDRHRSDVDRRRRTDRRSRRPKRRRKSSTCWANCSEALAKTIILVTHDQRAAERAHRELHLEKGQLVEQKRRRNRPKAPVRIEAPRRRSAAE